MGKGNTFVSEGGIPKIQQREKTISPEVGNHPDTDSLKLCILDGGEYELTQIVSLSIGKIGDRIKHFLTIIDTPDVTEYKSMGHLTQWDIAEIEKLFQDGSELIYYGNTQITLSDFRKIKIEFQKHRFNYAQTLWNGSNEVKISGLKSKYALSEMQESNRIHIAEGGGELITSVKLEEMQSQVNY